jgi:hypothetical protein
MNWKLIVLWALSLVVVGVLSASAQNDRLTISPQFVNGDDIGFRIERTVDGVPVGRLVVRVDGRWVNVESPSSTPR